MRYFDGLIKRLALITPSLQLLSMDLSKDLRVAEWCSSIIPDVGDTIAGLLAIHSCSGQNLGDGEQKFA